MCNPMLVLMVAATGASLAAQQESANSQQRANDVQTHNSLQARSDNANQINAERVQQTESASQKINANNAAMREAQSASLANAGAQGISGLSVDSLLGDMARKGATYDQSVNENLSRVNFALDNQLLNTNRNSASEINSLKTPQQPDYLGSALKIGGAVYGGMTANATDGAPAVTGDRNYGNEGRNYQSYTTGHYG